MQQQRVLEKRVDDLIGQVAERFGARLVHNVILQVDDRFSHFDYILIDCFGPLVIDVELWPGYSIAGDANAPTWTATPADGRTEWFSNPLLANRQRARDLHQVLLLNGSRLAPEYVTDLVVFDGSDTSALQLPDFERLRVLDLALLEDAVRSRYDFAPNPGGLQRLDVDAFAGRLHALDRTASIATSHLDNKRNEASAAQLTAVWGAVGMASKTGRAIWTLAAFVIGTLAVGAVGYIGIDRALTNAAMKVETQSVQAPATSLPAPTDRLTLAKRAYQSAAPREYAATVDLNTPEVLGDTFTWHFVRRTGESRGVPQAVSVTIDDKGRLVRIENGAGGGSPTGLTLVP